jgi:hypothetical protein
LWRESSFTLFFVAFGDFIFAPFSFFHACRASGVLFLVVVW